ncbi:hypothetical protein VaNZ11_016364 [Volvox africanus]|uniref:RAP domain-containing protein n=1 Tax=Volvox africanus TaxID=51714 RepID=A0ABQ5SP45_9CHLO|nr:hypothetical protein VaNZ11_016364 [Volvox africanus]
MLRTGYLSLSFSIAERRHVCHESSSSSSSRVTEAAAPQSRRHAPTLPGPQSSKASHLISVDLPKTGSGSGDNISSEHGREIRSFANGRRSNSRTRSSKRGQTSGADGSGNVVEDRVACASGGTNCGPTSGDVASSSSSSSSCNSLEGDRRNTDHDGGRHRASRAFGRGRGKRDIIGAYRPRSAAPIADSMALARQINRAIVEAGSSRNCQDILQIVDCQGGNFSAVNVATALHRLGSCGLQPGSWEAKRVLTDPRFSRLMETLAEQHLTSLSGPELANCLWALAKLGYNHPQRGAGAGSGSLSSSVSGSGSRHDGGRVMESSGVTGAGSSASGGERRRKGSRGVSNSSSGGSGIHLLQGLSVRMEVVLGQLSSQAVAKTLWALGRLGHHPGEHLLRGLTNRLLKVLADASSQDVSNSLLGLAKLKWSPGRAVLDQVAHGSLPRIIAESNAQELANTLWSMAHLNYSNNQLQAAIFHQALERLATFNTQNISNLVWAAATLGLGPDLGPNPSGDDIGGSSGRDGGGRGGIIFKQQKQGLIPEVLLQKCCDRAAMILLEGFAPQELSNLLWATAKMGYRHQALLTAAADQAARQLAAGAGMGAACPSGQQHQHQHVQPICWPSQAVANTTWAYATLGAQPGEKYLLQVCRQLSSPQLLPGYKWQEMANTVWALATLQYRDCTAALAAVEREVLARLGGGPATDLANVDHNNSTGGQHQQHNRPTQQRHNNSIRHSRRLLESQPELRPQHVSNLLWSYATLEHPAPDLFTTFLPLLERRLPLFSEQEISNSVWATARLQVYDEKIMDAVADHICSHRLPYLKPQEVANIAWAYGGLRHEHKALFDGLVECMVDFIRMPAAAAAPVADSTVAAAAASYTALPAAETDFEIDTDVDTEIDTRHTHTNITRTAVKIQELSSICGAVASFGWYYPVLLVATKQWLMRAAGTFPRSIHRQRQQELQQQEQQGDQSGSSSCCGTGSPSTGITIFHHQRQEGATAGAVVALEAAPPGGAGQLAEAAAGQGREIGSAQQQLLTSTDECYSRPYRQQQPHQPHQQLVKARDVCNLTWALSLVGGCSPGMWAQLMELMGRVVEERGGSGFHELLDEELSQMYQAYLYVQLDYPTAALAPGPPGLLSEGLQAWRWQSLQGPLVSSFQMEVSRALNRLGLSHTVELLTNDGKFSIDLAVEVEVDVDMEVLDLLIRNAAGVASQARGSSFSHITSANRRLVRVAVEADGPWHFTANTRQPLSPTLYRRRCLEDRGWVVVSVPYWRWNQCRTSTSDGATSSGPADQEEALLLQLMREEGLGEVIEAVAAG